MTKKIIYQLILALFLFVENSSARQEPKTVHGTVDGTLPVTLTSFTVNLEGEDILIKWKTANEQNSNYFNVQVSKDGTGFKTIGTIKAAGTTNTFQNYQFIYTKTAYAQLFSVAALLLISIGRPKKYLMFAALILLVICFASCEKDKPDIHGTLYFRLEQVDLNGMTTQFGPNAVTL